MLKKLRHNLIQALWTEYRQTSFDVKILEAGLSAHHMPPLALDHFAIIDLPSQHSGLDTLTLIFSALGFQVQGRDYLAAKQNPFLWLAESDSVNQKAEHVLPQVVVADFILDEMPIEIKTIIEKYTAHIPPSPLINLQKNCREIFLGHDHAIPAIVKTLLHYFAGRNWPAPTLKDFYEVQAFNELLAWVLVFGRRPNHFTYSVHLAPQFQTMQAFINFIQHDLNIPLNTEGGLIKGNASTGIEQSSSMGHVETIALADGNIQLARGFFEFVWRYPCAHQPLYWQDYFTGFIAQQADYVIESLFEANRT